MTPDKPEKSGPEQPPSVRGRRRRVGTPGGSVNQTTLSVLEHRNSHISSNTVAQDNETGRALPPRDHQREQDSHQIGR